ncbi:MAG: fibronectin type III domain-containing protein, partial [Clostridia bacterium]
MRFMSKVLILIVLFILSLTTPILAIDPALKPTNVHITSVTDSTVTLQWDKVDSTSVTGYRLYLLEDNKYSPVGDTIPKPAAAYTYSYSLPNTDNVREFRFIIASIDKNDALLAMSDALTIHLSVSQSIASP